MMKTLDLGFHTKDEAGLGKRLSNLYAYEFDIDGRHCGSMEGFLQALKFDNLEIQEELSKMSGYPAYKFGQEGNDWKETQTLYFQDKSYERSSKSFSMLIEKAYDCCFDQNKGFQDSLLESGVATLTHFIGKTDQRDTTLTVHEYLYHMYRIRSKAFVALDI